MSGLPEIGSMDVRTSAIADVRDCPGDPFRQNNCKNELTPRIPCDIYFVAKSPSIGRSAGLIGWRGESSFMRVLDALSRPRQRQMRFNVTGACQRLRTPGDLTVRLTGRTPRAGPSVFAITTHPGKTHTACGFAPMHDCFAAYAARLHWRLKCRGLSQKQFTMSR
jgi:hypothetical protein